MNSTEVQNSQRKLDVFGSVLASAKSTCVLDALQTSSLSFNTNNSPSDSKAFLDFMTVFYKRFRDVWPQCNTVD